MAVGVRTQKRANSVAQAVLLSTSFALMVAVFARVAIYTPLTPVPFTLQPMAIMLTGLMLGPNLGALALLEYLAAGALGAPVFAGGNGGWLYLAHTPTLGYLLSYPVAVYVVGRIAEAARMEYWRLLVAALAGLVIIYLGGNAYLSLWLHTGAMQTLLLGAGVFIGLDSLKAVLAAGVARTTRWRPALF